MIKRNGLPFHQWELDRQISVENVEFDEIHFENKLIKKALVTEPSSNKVNVPNILLQSAENIHVFVMKDEKVVEHTSFGVCPRKQPEDYVYTETEHFTYAEIEARVKKLEENQNAGGIADGGVITSKIADGAVTEEKLSKELSEKINKDNVFEIGDGSITNEKLADGAVTEDKLDSELFDKINTIIETNEQILSVNATLETVLNGGDE